MTTIVISLFLLLVHIIGGLGMTLFVGGAVVFACSSRSPFSLGYNFMFGVVLQLLVIAAFWTAGGVLQSIPFLRSLMFGRLQLGDQFSALPFSEGSRSLTMFGSILVLLLLPISSIGIRTVWGRSREPVGTQRSREWFVFIAGVSALAPYVLTKITRPEHLLAATMSGDARNHFLIVQQARVSTQMANFLSPSDLASPRFPHAVTAVISSANGSTGINHVGDQWAIGGMTWVSLAIIAIAAALAVESVLRAKPNNGSSFHMVALSISLGAIPSVSYWLYPVLADGFFTLVVGVMLLVATTALSISVIQHPKFRIQVGSVVIGIYLVTLAYPYLAIPAAALILIIAREPYADWFRRRRHEALSALLGTVLVVAYLGRMAFPKFIESAALVGSVIPRNTSIIVVVAGFALFAYLRLRGPSGFAVLAGLTGTLFTVFLVESAAGNEAPGYSYYSTKVLLAGSLLGLVFLPALLIDLSRSDEHPNERQTSNRMNRYVLLSIVVGLMPVAVARAGDATPFVPRLVWSGWSTPSPESVATATNDWGTEPTAYFRFTPSGEDWNTAEDRLMNFWSPTFWSGFEGPYTGLWNWVYLSHVSGETQVICDGVSGGITKIITRDSGLRLDMNVQCPDVAKTARIEVRQ